MRRSERLKRNLKIAKLRKEHPEFTLEEIGEKYGLTAAGVNYAINSVKEKIK